jgi:hypothetical protein
MPCVLLLRRMTKKFDTLNCELITTIMADIYRFVHVIFVQLPCLLFIFSLFSERAYCFITLLLHYVLLPTSILHDLAFNKSGGTFYLTKVY